MWYCSRPIQPGDSYDGWEPKPRFQPGDLVQTVVGVVGGDVVKTALALPVTWFGWHFKRKTWVYRLARPGRRKRWYLESQLQFVDRSNTDV
jgi:hypothetical protein